MNALLYYLTGDELFSKKRSLLAMQAVRLVCFCMKAKCLGFIKVTMWLDSLEV